MSKQNSNFDLGKLIKTIRLENNWKCDYQRIWIKSKTADATVKGPSKKSIITNTTIKISILREPLATACFKPLLTVMIPI
jgi:hypothetical protein